MNRKEICDALFKDLHGRTNVMTRRSERDQMIVIYDDHRWILNVLYALLRHDILPDLIYFDAHEDAAQCEEKPRLLEKIGVPNLLDATPKQFGAFVDYDLREDDGNWLTAAMELDIIGDVVNIGNRYNDNFKQWEGRYQSNDGIFHNVFELSEDIDFELGCKGKLGDTCKSDEYRGIRDFFGVEHYYSNTSSIHIAKPYILDFDLDFFTISCDLEIAHGWTEKILSRRMPCLSKAGLFLKHMIDNALVITICREPDYCGSIGDSNRILSLLDYNYFKGYLGTDVTL